MTLEKFMKILEKAIEEDDDFIVYTAKNDSSFKHLGKDTMVVCGYGEKEIFALQITKIKS